MLSRKLPGFLAAISLVAGVFVMSPASASAAGAATCAGGPVVGGTYDSLQIGGFCLVVAGDVTVTHDVTVLPGGILFAAFAGSNMTIGGNLNVQSGGMVALGCEPNAFTCFNDKTNTLSTADSIGGNLVADGALLVLMHADTIGGNVIQSGGGGGVNCNLLPFGPPAYSTYEDNTIRGNANISGLRTCWLGFFRNHVSNVNWHNNQTFDPDGNEIATNTISGNLNCSANGPAPQLGDSVTVGNGPNTVLGRNTGQCPPVLQSS